MYEVMTRDQIRRNTKTEHLSIRTINYSLKDLKDEGYILFNNQTYRLSKKGANYIGAKWEKNIGQLQHRIIRNDFLLYYKPSNFEFEKEILIGEHSYGICDAVLSDNVILEVDNEQTWSENKNKLDRYAMLFKILKGYELFWVIKYELRKEMFLDLMKELGIPGRVYLWNEIR